MKKFSDMSDDGTGFVTRVFKFRGWQLNLFTRLERGVANGVSIERRTWRVQLEHTRPPRYGRVHYPGPE